MRSSFHITGGRIRWSTWCGLITTIENKGFSKDAKRKHPLGVEPDQLVEKEWLDRWSDSCMDG